MENGWWSCLIRSLDFGLLPPIVDPKPISRVAPNCRFKRSVDVTEDVGRGPGAAILPRGNLLSSLNAPSAQANAIADAGVKRAMVTQGENGRGSRSRAVAAQEGQ